MKNRFIDIFTFAFFLLPLLLILGSPTISSKALRLDQPSNRSASAPIKKTFYAMGGLYDGWVLESGEFTNVGGSINSTNTSIRLGDDAGNRQYRSIISFNTGYLPRYASIQSAKLYLTKSGVVGISPFKFGNLNVDIKRGVFGSSRALQLTDFQAAPSLLNSGIPPACYGLSKCGLSLTARSFAYVNRSGLTQLRLRFTPDDNNNKKADTALFFSGDTTTVANRPMLVVYYYP